jgi:hypothetical protein
MVTGLQIATLSNDNGKSSFRAQELKVGHKQVRTPSRALEPARLRPEADLELSLFGFCEIYREIGPALAANLEKDSEKLGEYSSRLRSAATRGPPHAPTLCIVKYVPGGSSAWPTPSTVNLLSDTAHSYSDIVPLPAIDRRLTLDDVPRLNQFVRACYRSVERLNTKPVMGYLPTLPREAYGPLIDFYVGEGIRCFYFDFEGRMPDHLKMRPILVRLAEKRVLDDSLIYGLNARPGRFLRNADVIPSRDFIAHGYGVDVLGGRHVRPPFPPTSPIGRKGSRLAAAVEAQKQNRRRLFLKTDYGYHRIKSSYQLGQSYPSDSRVPKAGMFGETGPLFENLFNMEQQAMEALNLSERLQSQSRSESILNYIRTKKEARSDLPRLRKSAQRSLREFS